MKIEIALPVLQAVVRGENPAVRLLTLPRDFCFDLPLSLLMPEIFANNHYFPASSNDFTLITNRFDGCSYFQDDQVLSNCLARMG